MAQFDGTTLQLSGVPQLESLDDGKVVDVGPGFRRGRGLMAVEAVEPIEEQIQPLLKEDEIEGTAADSFPARIPVHVFDAERPDMPAVVKFSLGADKIDDAAVKEATRAVEGNPLDGSRWWVREVWARWRDGENAIVIYAHKRGA